MISSPCSYGSDLRRLWLQIRFSNSGQESKDKNAHVIQNYFVHNFKSILTPNCIVGSCVKHHNANPNLYVILVK